MSRCMNGKVRHLHVRGAGGISQSKVTKQQVGSKSALATGSKRFTGHSFLLFSSFESFLRCVFEVNQTS